LNAFAASPLSARVAIREKIIEVLSNGDSIIFKDSSVHEEVFFARQNVELHLPIDVSEFSDFSCYEEHVGNVRQA
jgi:fumarylacetoacetase